MSDTKPTTTRRSALSTALTSLLAAGAASICPRAAQAAPEPTTAQPDPLTALLQTDAQFAVWYGRWQAKRDQADAKASALWEHIWPHVDEKTARAIHEWEEARADRVALDWQFFFEATARHFPGIAPALRLAWLHVIDGYEGDAGSCCTDGTEPW